MRFIRITAQCFVMIFAAQIVALCVIFVHPEADFSKTMAIVMIPSILLFLYIFRHSRSGILDAAMEMRTKFSTPDKASDFFLGMYSVILLLFLFTLSDYLWRSWTT